MKNNWHTPMQEDLRRRSPDIHWAEGFNPEKADLFAHNELVIHAPAEKIWKHLIEAPKWATWYPNSNDVSIVGESDTLQSDSIFHWTTFGLALESKVSEFEPNSRLSWYGYAPGTQPNFYHTWYIVPQDDGSCLVITEEVGIGPDAAMFQKSNEGLLHRGHDLWLAGVKWIAEDGE
jgi:uncharacterized protein YndB with AHSA1/START domain